MRWALLCSFLACALSGCSKQGEDSTRQTGQQSAPVPGTNISGTPYVPYSPGSYFKVMTEVGDKKDTRVVEFQYLSSGKFILTQTSFLGGDLGRGYFQKKIGTYTEDTGRFVHDISYDTCGDLSRIYTSVTGDRRFLINISWKGNVAGFYSYATRTLPSDISSHIVEAVEDVGCRLFQGN